jgi:dephospho-CoA kinase
MLNAGLTGGIGCGKSTVAKMLADKGARVIDFDVLTHRVQEPGQAAWKAIIDRFGEGVLNTDRSIDRTRLGSVVLADPEKLRQLNDIVHPVVLEEWRRQLAEIEKGYPEAIVLSDIPLLVEAGIEDLFDLVVVVYAAPEDQIRRIMERNGYSRDEAQKRLSVQMPIDEKLKHADIVVRNQASLDRTRDDVDRVWKELVAKEREKRKGNTIKGG